MSPDPNEKSRTHETSKKIDAEIERRAVSELHDYLVLNDIDYVAEDWMNNPDKAVKAVKAYYDSEKPKNDTEHYYKKLQLKPNQAIANQIVQPLIKCTTKMKLESIKKPATHLPRKDFYHYISNENSEFRDYKSWGGNPSQVITIINGFLADSNIPDSDKARYKLFKNRLQAEKTPNNKENMILNEIIDPLYRHEVKIQKTDKALNNLGQDVLAKKIGEGFDSLYQNCWGDMSSKGKVGVAILAGVVIWKLLSFKDTRMGQWATTGIAFGASWAGLDAAVRAFSKGESNLGFQKVANWAVDVFDGDAQAGTNISSYQEAFDESPLAGKSQFFEEFTALHDRPISQCISVYKDVRTKSGGQAKGYIDPRDLGIDIKYSQAERVKGDDLYAMLDYIFGGDFDKDMDYSSDRGDFSEDYKESPISFGNFMYDIFRKRSAEPGTIGKAYDTVKGTASGMFGAAANWLSDVSPFNYSDEEITNVAAGVLGQVNGLNLKIKNDLTGTWSAYLTEEYSDLDLDEIGLLRLISNDAKWMPSGSWLGQMKIALEGDDLDAKRDAVRLYEIAKELVTDSYEDVRRAYTIEERAKKILHPNKISGVLTDDGISDLMDNLKVLNPSTRLPLSPPELQILGRAAGTVAGYGYSLAKAKADAESPESDLDDKEALVSYYDKVNTTLDAAMANIKQKIESEIEQLALDVNILKADTEYETSVPENLRNELEAVFYDYWSDAILENLNPGEVYRPFIIQTIVEYYEVKKLYNDVKTEMLGNRSASMPSSLSEFQTALNGLPDDRAMTKYWRKVIPSLKGIKLKAMSNYAAFEKKGVKYGVIFNPSGFTISSYNGAAWEDMHGKVDISLGNINAEVANLL